MESIVETLVNRRLKPSVLLAQLANLSDFPCLVVTDTVTLKETLLVELINSAQSVCKRHGAVRSMKIPSGDLINIQCLQARKQASTQVLGRVVVNLLGRQCGSDGRWVEFGIELNTATGAV